MECYSVSQLFWAAAMGGSLEIKEPGHCRICGGPLVGGAADFYSRPRDTWVDEGLVADRGVSRVCRACVDVTSDSTKVRAAWRPAAHGGGSGPPLAVLVTAEPAVRFYVAGGKRRALEAALGSRWPYALLVRYPAGNVQRHVIPYMPLSAPGGDAWVAFADKMVCPVNLGRVLRLADGDKVDARPWEIGLARWVVEGKSKPEEGEGE